MQEVWYLERAAHARAVATAKGRRVGRPLSVDPDRLAYAAHEHRPLVGGAASAARSADG